MNEGAATHLPTHCALRVSEWVGALFCFGGSADSSFGIDSIDQSINQASFDTLLTLLLRR